MKTRIALITLILFIFGLTGCAAAATPAPSREAAVAPSAPGVAADNFGGKTANTVAQPAAAQPRLVIKNAELSIVVDDPAGGMTAIMNMANEMGGYVVTSKSFTTRAESGADVPQAAINVRVPAEKLDAAMAQIKKLVKDPSQDVRLENVTGQDVTADYIDQQSRLTNLQNTEKQLQRLQDSATKMDDVLTIFNKLTEVRQQIEQTKGQIKYYEESAALSSINVQLISKAGIAPISIGGWQPVGVASEAFQTLINIGKGLVDVLIWLVIVFLPLGLVLYFPGRWLWRLAKRFAPKPRPVMPYSNMPVMQPYPMQGPVNPTPGPGGPPPSNPQI
jgi:hypothetical protein